ncbi:unnamed protein product [Rhizoctonia solani]|uniref:Uncharacterized protein n=1 Tax=Rhizoctonia solani TaxID=456999 RepID=A0A8H3HE26_9AGAM|nr:unnamed protein product [Rhizoctonia solani]
MDGNPFAVERFKCDLMWGNDHWVTLLARNLSIHDGWTTVYFRPDYGFDSTAYYIRYMTEKSGSVVNTAHFTLSQMNGTNFSQMFNEQPDPNVVSHGSGGSHPAPNGHMNPSAPSGAHPTSTSPPAEVSQSMSRPGGPIGPFGSPPTLQHWVSLLARNLSIYNEWTMVYFRPDYGFDSTAYYIRYMTEESGSVVNTTRFTLSQMNGTNFSQLFNEQPEPNVVSHGSGGSLPASNAHTDPSASVTQATPSSYITSGQTARLGQAGNSPSPTGTYPTSTSPSGFTNEADQNASQAGGPIGPLGTPPTPSLDDTEDSEPTPTSNRSGAVSLTRQRESAWQKVSLALWPVLVGAVMAM